MIKHTLLFSLLTVLIILAGCASKSTAASKSATVNTAPPAVNPADVERLAPKTDLNAAAGSGQSEVNIRFPGLNADWSICVFVNDKLTAQVTTNATEKILVRNGKNTYKFVGYRIASTLTGTQWQSAWTEQELKKDAVIIADNDITNIELSSPSGVLFFTVKKEGLPGIAKKTVQNPNPSAAPTQASSQGGGSYSVSVNGVPTGPFTITELRSMAQKKELTQDTLVWQEGMPQWVRAGTVKELEQVFGAVPPPLPPR
jgi:PBP1b-binding outer membrane lipoprotein LpoB